MFNPESLLLINDYKAEIFKLDIIREKSMCSNNDIDSSGFQSR